MRGICLASCVEVQIQNNGLRGVHSDDQTFELAEKDWSYHEYPGQRKVGEERKLGPHRVLWGKSPIILDVSLGTTS